MVLQICVVRCRKRTSDGRRKATCPRLEPIFRHVAEELLEGGGDLGDVVVAFDLHQGGAHEPREDDVHPADIIPSASLLGRRRVQDMLDVVRSHDEPDKPRELVPADAAHEHPGRDGWRGVACVEIPLRTKMIHAGDFVKGPFEAQICRGPPRHIGVVRRARNNKRLRWNHRPSIAAVSMAYFTSVPLRQVAEEKFENPDLRLCCTSDMNGQ